MEDIRFDGSQHQQLQPPSTYSLPLPPSPYEFQHHPPPAHAEPAGAPPAGPSPLPFIVNNHYQQPLRKNMRAVQACDTCRTRKAKCDEGKPVCGYCRENAQPCTYKDVAPAKVDRAQQAIIDQIKTTGEKIDRLQRLIKKIEYFISSGAAAQHSSPSANPAPKMKDPGDAMPSHTSDMSAGCVPAGSVIVDHNTGVHRLLRWPTISGLLRRKKVDEDFVIRMEENKGMIRLYGKGYGRDTWDGDYTPNPASPATTSSSGHSESPGPYSLDNWGSDLGLPNTSETRKPSLFDLPGGHPGGLNRDGSLQIDTETMVRLWASYLNYIHILHPFLDKAKLNNMFDRFWTQNVTDPSPAQSPFVANHPPARPDPGSNQPPHGAATYVMKAGCDQVLERRLSTAIVLIVMALGKICSHEHQLPAVAPAIKEVKPPSREPLYTTSNTYFPLTSEPPQYRPSPMYSTASLHHSTTSSSPMSEGSGCSLIDTPGSVSQNGDRNVDVIPGLAYFTRALEIMSGLPASNDLPQVQACLLAGLYTSQLALIIDSWKWIQSACMACHFLVRDDILAEMDLRGSGIERSDNQPTIPFPVGEADNSAKIMMYYSSQIVLRTTLNRIQRLLYPANSQNTDQVDPTPDIRRCEASLTQWRDSLPLSMQWSDNDPPPKDINEARLRAKYYEANYIIHRPSLYYALHNWPSKYPASTNNPIDSEIHSSVELCIQAAKNSTLAFDGIQNLNRRLIVANIFVTAHAQFGSMLVLAAAYNNLPQYIKKFELQNLFSRTIAFLSGLGPISPTLAFEAEVLSDIQRDLLV